MAFFLIKFRNYATISKERTPEAKKMPDLSFFDQYLQGHLPEAYKYFGAHKGELNGRKGYFFRVYAPMAKDVSVIGDFNDWKPEKGRMQKLDYRGLYETFIPGATELQKYKFHILGCDGFWKDKQDPFAFLDQPREEGCSQLLIIPL